MARGFRGSVEMKLVAMYNLKKKANLEEFKRWSREVDQKVTSGLPGYKRFDIFEVAALLDGSKPPYRYTELNTPYKIIEFIEVESQEVLERSQSSPAMNRVMKEWSDFVDESSVKILRVEQI